MVFPDSKVVETDLIGSLDLLDQVPHPFRRILGAAGLVECCRETIDPHLHQPSLIDIRRGAPGIPCENVTKTSDLVVSLLGTIPTPTKSHESGFGHESSRKDPSVQPRKVIQVALRWRV